MLGNFLSFPINKVLYIHMALIQKCKKYHFLSLNLNFLSYSYYVNFSAQHSIYSARRGKCNPVTSLTFRRERAAATISVLQKVPLGFDANQTNTPC